MNFAILFTWIYLSFCKSLSQRKVTCIYVSMYLSLHNHRRLVALICIKRPTKLLQQRWWAQEKSSSSCCSTLLTVCSRSYNLLTPFHLFTLTLIWLLPAPRRHHLFSNVPINSLCSIRPIRAQVGRVAGAGDGGAHRRAGRSSDSSRSSSLWCWSTSATNKASKASLDQTCSVDASTCCSTKQAIAYLCARSLRLWPF